MTQPALRTSGLTKRYGGTTVLSDLDLELGPGEVLGYLGPNGAGKTTTIRLILGLARPSAGRSDVFGFDSQSEAVEAHRRLAYVPGEANLWPSLTGGETLHLLGEIHGAVDATYREPTTRATTPPTTAAPATRTATSQDVAYRYGDLQLAVTKSGTRISNISVVADNASDTHSYQINEQAMPTLIQQAMSAQTANIDGVSGATFTSEAFVQAMQSALNQLG